LSAERKSNKKERRGNQVVTVKREAGEFKEEENENWKELKVGKKGEGKKVE